MNRFLLVALALVSLSAHGRGGGIAPCPYGGACELSDLSVDGQSWSGTGYTPFLRNGWRSEVCTGFIIPHPVSNTQVNALQMGSVAASGTCASNQTCAGRNCQICTTGAVAGNTAGYIVTTSWKLSQPPRAMFSVATSSDISAIQAVFGLGQSAFMGGAWTPAAGPTADAGEMYVVAFDPGISNKWRFCTGDGSNITCVDVTGSPDVVINTNYHFEFDPRTEPGTAITLNMWIGDLDDSPDYTVRKTTNIPSVANSSQVYQTEIRIETTGAAARAFNFYRALFEWECL